MGAPHRDPLTWFPGPAGADGPDRQHCLLPASSSLLSAPQTPGADAETEVGEGERHWGKERVAGPTSTMKRPTQTTQTHLSLFPTDRLLPSPLPCVTPLLSAPSFNPKQQPQPDKDPHSVWPSSPLLAISLPAFSQICQTRSLLFERHVWCFAWMVEGPPLWWPVCGLSVAVFTYRGDVSELYSCVQ